MTATDLARAADFRILREKFCVVPGLSEIMYMFVCIVFQFLKRHVCCRNTNCRLLLKIFKEEPEKVFILRNITLALTGLAQ